MHYVFKTILNFEGTSNRKRDYGLKNTLNSEGTKKMRWRKEILINTSQEREKRERVPDNSMKLFVVFFELSGVLYLYRDFVTIIAKISIAVTLIDKIKMEFLH